MKLIIRILSALLRLFRRKSTRSTTAIYPISIECGDMSDKASIWQRFIWWFFLPYDSVFRVRESAFRKALWEEITK